MAVLVPVRPFSHHVLDFLAYLEFERALSRNTLEAYRSDLLQLGAFLDRRGVDDRGRRARRPRRASWSDLATGAPDRPPVAAATLQRKAACLRSFYRHLRREQVIDHDPTADLRAPRKSQRLPQVLSRDEVGRLLAAPRGHRPGRPARPGPARAHVRLRAARLRGRRPRGRATSTSRRSVLRARGKGAKERLVPVGREALAAVQGLAGARAPGARRARARRRGCSSTAAAPA